MQLLNLNIILMNGMVKHMINRIKKYKQKVKNQKGAYAIIAVILVFILIMMLAGFSDMMSKRFVINEVQGIMDSSGTNALKENVDYTLVRQEVLGTDSNNYGDTENQRLNYSSELQNKIINAYKTELSRQMQSNSAVHDLQFDDVKVRFDYDTFGLGKSTKIRPQITLESIIRLHIKTYSQIDYAQGLSAMAYSSRDDSNFQVQYQGMTGDGEAEIVVRSVSRLVYR